MPDPIPTAEVRELLAKLDSRATATATCKGLIYRQLQADELFTTWPKLRAILEEAIKGRDRIVELVKWANCGGVPSGKVCTVDPNDHHQIYGPGVTDEQTGVHCCELHEFRRRIHELERERDSNASITVAAQDYAKELEQQLTATKERIGELESTLNTPQLYDFSAAGYLRSVEQRQKDLIDDAARQSAVPEVKE